MKRKVLSFLLAMVLVMTSAFTLVGCKTGDETSSDPKTINVRARIAGYGVDWLDEYKTAFESIYAEEGYKVNVLPPLSDLTSTNVFQDIYSRSGIDVYFSGDCDLRTAVEGSYGQLFADVTDLVVNQPSIGYDGQNEEGTVYDKIKDGNYDVVYKDKYYAVPFASGFSGLAVNTRVLSEYNLEIPRTTDELFECAVAIMDKANENEVFPFTYSNSGNYYPSGLVNTWLAQYLGEGGFNTFWSMIDENGNNLDGQDGRGLPYSVFDNPAIEEVLYELFRTFDYRTFCYGSVTEEFGVVQGQLMRGDAAFYCVGDWMLNEEKIINASRLNDVTIVRIPLISHIGKSLFGAGTKYNLDDAKADDVLSLLAKMVDEEKDIAEMKTAVSTEFGVTLDDSDIQTVIAKRGLTRDSGTGSGIYISEYSEKKDIAALFVRLCTSYDAGVTFAKKSWSNSPYAPDALKDSEYQWTRSSSAILSNKYTNLVVAASSGYRERYGLHSFFPSSDQGGMPYNIVFGKDVTRFDKNTLKIIGEGTVADKIAQANAVYRENAEELAKDLFNDQKRAYDNGIWKLIW